MNKIVLLYGACQHKNYQIIFYPSYNTYFFAFQVQSLQVVGGINFENCVRRILRKFMVDDLAAMFSWMGAKQKRPFSALLCSKAIFGKEIFSL